MTYVTNTFLLVSSSVRSKQLLCFVQGQGQKSEQKHTIKDFVGFLNHSPLLTMARRPPFWNLTLRWKQSHSSLLVPFWFLVLYWSLQEKMAQFRILKFMFEVKTSVIQRLGSMCKFNTGLQWYGQQFPCILIASTKSLLSSRDLYNVHEKSLIEGECESNY